MELYLCFILYDLTKCILAEIYLFLTQIYCECALKIVRYVDYGAHWVSH